MGFSSAPCLESLEETTISQHGGAWVLGSTVWLQESGMDDRSAQGITAQGWAHSDFTFSPGVS